MKYTLTENAISSFHLAIENFKKFAYRSSGLLPSELDEARKLCAIFLENSIELFLKVMIITKDPLAIYKKPESKKIRNAKAAADAAGKPLEDVLIARSRFETITFSKSIIEYGNKFHYLPKMKKIFEDLGLYRNKLTHFGIDESEDDEFTIACINAFQVIYQDLYENLIKLAAISDYLMDDDFFNVRTVHGIKSLINENGFYNNIIDFLDSLSEEASDWCFKLRRYNIKYPILQN